MSWTPPPTYPPPGYPPPGYPPPVYGGPSPYPSAVGYGSGLPPLAGVGARFGALMFDSVASLVFFVPGVAAFLVGPREPGTCTDADGFERACEVPTAGTILAGIGLIIVGYLLIVAYHTVPVARSGRTLGRRLFGIRVIDARTLAPPSAGKALGRYLFETWVSAQMCYLGLLWALWDPEKRTWHDMVCDTRVVRA